MQKMTSLDVHGETNSTFSWNRLSHPIRCIFIASLAVLLLIGGTLMLGVLSIGSFLIILFDTGQDEGSVLIVYCVTTCCVLLLLVFNTLPIIGYSIVHFLLVVSLLLFIICGCSAGLLFCNSLSDYEEVFDWLETTLLTYGLLITIVFCAAVFTLMTSVHMMPYVLLILGYIVVYVILNDDKIREAVSTKISTYTLLAVYIASVLISGLGVASSWFHLLVEIAWLASSSTFCGLVILSMDSPTARGNITVLHYDGGNIRHCKIASCVISLALLPFILSIHGVQKELLPWFSLGVLLHGMLAVKVTDKKIRPFAVVLLVYYLGLSWIYLPAKAFVLIGCLFVVCVLTMVAVYYRQEELLNVTLFLHAVGFHFSRSWLTLDNSGLAGFMVYPVLFAIYKLQCQGHLHYGTAALLGAVHLTSLLGSQPLFPGGLILFLLILLTLSIAGQPQRFEGVHTTCLAALFALHSLNCWFELEAFLQSVLHVDLDFSLSLGCCLGATGFCSVWLNKESGNTSVGKGLILGAAACALIRPPLTWELCFFTVSCSLFYWHLLDHSRPVAHRSYFSDSYGVPMVCSLLCGAVGASIAGIMMQVELKMPIFSAYILYTACIVFVCILLYRDGLGQYKYVKISITACLCSVILLSSLGESFPCLGAIMCLWLASMLHGYLHWHRLDALDERTHQVYSSVRCAANVLTILAVMCLWCIRDPLCDQLHWSLISCCPLILLQQDPYIFKVGLRQPLGVVLAADFIITAVFTVVNSAFWTKRHIARFCGLVEILVTIVMLPAWVDVVIKVSTADRSASVTNNNAIKWLAPLALYLPVFGTHWSAWEMAATGVAGSLWVYLPYIV